eukprot:313409-Amphidinium_carterae.1
MCIRDSFYKHQSNSTSRSKDIQLHGTFDLNLVVAQLPRHSAMTFASWRATEKRSCSHPPALDNPLTSKKSERN